MATLKHVDLLSNTDLDDNLIAVIDHVNNCTEEYGKTNVFVNA